MSLVSSSRQPCHRHRNTTTSPQHHWLQRLCFFAFILALAPGLVHGQLSQPGILREVYSDIPGVSVSDLINSPNFPDSPDSEEILTELFEAPTDVAEQYGQRLRAILVPPATGTYVFWIASDDGGELYLSTDATPASKRLISSVPGWTSSRDWTSYPEQESAAISLIAGRQYYIEALMKEEGGGDNLAVGWRLPNGTLERPIAVQSGNNTRLFVYGLGAPEITKEPADASVLEGQAAYFDVEVARRIGLTFQWERNRVEIPNETNSFLYFHNPTSNNDGDLFRCVLVNELGTENTREARLSVQHDNTPPAVTSAFQLANPRQLTVRFNKPVDPITAADASNYILEPTVNVFEARPLPDGFTVVLDTDPLVLNAPYSLRVQNVTDQTSQANTVSSSTSFAFTVSLDPVDIRFIRGGRERIGPSNRRGPWIISEVHYQPSADPEGANLQFIELFNSHDWPEELGGFRLEGDIHFTFPTDLRIPARGFVLVAPDPAAVEAAYGLKGVFGPVESLPKDGGSIRLRNHSGGLLANAVYSPLPPYPAAAAGAGHSLVLARPSYGGSNPEAWAASDRVGGSPGREDGVSLNPYATILINEFLAHTDEPLIDFIELFNYSNQPIDVSGCTLSDRPDQDRFAIPEGTIIPAFGFLHYTETDLGFALSTLGESIYLKNPDATKVIDAIIFGPQANGISYGRHPDGAPTFQELASPTPGTANSDPLRRPIIISEIMYHPISHHDDDTYIELYNRSDETVDLAGWKLTEGIRFDFPPGTSLAAGQYLVLAKNAARLRITHPHLTEANCLGDFGGRLSRSGERLALTMPDITHTLAQDGTTITNLIDIVVHEVDYRDGGRWGQWSDGDGSSMELLDLESDHRLASNWGDSDETEKSSWTLIETTGVLDNGQSTANQLHIMMAGAGEALIDNIEVLGANGQNLLSNGTFEAGAIGWVAQGNHDTSTLTSPGFESSRALHLRANGRGDNGANRIRMQLSTSMAPGSTATIRARVRWLKGTPEVVLRIRGGYLEAIGKMDVPMNLGTPGLPNSGGTENLGPAIHGVTHNPILPGILQPVTVLAQVSDPDGLAGLELVYRLDPSTNTTTVPMIYRGAGFFSGTLPGQASGRIVAYHIRATDAAETPQTTLFPANAPVQECLVRFGETQPTGTLGTYRIWMTDAIFRRWSNRLKLDNGNLDVTYVYNGDRVVYNAGSRYSGSPFLSPGYNTPTGAVSGYVIEMPKDDQVLETSEFKLDWPIRDGTLQLEQMAYWMIGELGIPTNYRRFIHLHVNGVRRGTIFEDSQQPNGDFIEEWYPDDADGNLFKIEDWFEFSDNGSREFNQDATLQNFTTTGGQKKLARYRFTFRTRATDRPNDYDSLFDLIDTANLQGAGYTRAVESAIDTEQWLRNLAGRRITGDWDSFGYNRGKNMYAYHGLRTGWKMFNWDIDFVFGAGSDSPTTSLFNTIDSAISRMTSHPPFRRIYLRGFYDAAHGPLRPEIINRKIDERHAALLANNVGAANPSAGKQWLADRRAFLLAQLATFNASFAFTQPPGGGSTTATPTYTLQGTAPVQVRTLRFNGVAYPVEWTSVTAWRLRLPLRSGPNEITVVGYDSMDQPIDGFTATTTIQYTGPDALPQDHLVINEIMHSPEVPGAAFVEIHNTSTTHTFDLTSHRLAGVDFNFLPGTLIEPDGFLVAVEDLNTFNSTYGPGLSVAGQYSGRLQPEGERLRLVRLDDQGGTAEVLAEVTYGSQPPWPPAASGEGGSLQLIDPSQPNDRVGNWDAIAPAPGTGIVTELVELDHKWKYNQQGGDLGTSWRQPAFNDASWPVGPALLFVEPSALPGPKNTPLTLGRTTYYFRSSFNNPFADKSGLRLQMRTVIDDGCVIYLNGLEVLRLGMPGGQITYLTFANRTVDNAQVEGPFDIPLTALLPGNNVIAVEVHQVNAGSSDIVFGMTLSATQEGPTAFTPGTVNSTRRSIPDFAPLWINEILPRNTTGLTDNAGQRDPWIEIYNSGDSPVELDTFRLSHQTTPSPTSAWAFPQGATVQPGGFILVWADNQPEQSTANEWHASFALDPLEGAVYLHQVVDSEPVLVDYMSYSLAAPDRAFGRFPDGSSDAIVVLHTPTPAAPNTLAAPPVQVVINEWMAANSSTIANPVDGRFDDWFELYNPSNTAADLSGYHLTDRLDQPSKYTLPTGVVIPAGGFLVVWADGSPERTVPGTSIHVNFSLAREGEAIGLFKPDLTPVDTVEFGSQSTDVSEGRLPDAGPEPFHFFTTPTPGATNVADGLEPGFIPSGLAFESDGTLKMEIRVVAGRTYRLEYKDELSDLAWTLLVEVVADSGTLTLHDPLESDPQQRFYRFMEVLP